MLNLLLLAAALGAPATAPRPATNTLCPVLGNKVSPASPTVVVRGQTYKLCCKGCDVELEKNPGKYLGKDGTPKNAKASEPAKP